MAVPPTNGVFYMNLIKLLLDLASRQGNSYISIMGSIENGKTDLQHIIHGVARNIPIRWTAELSSKSLGNDKSEVQFLKGIISFTNLKIYEALFASAYPISVPI